MSGAGGAGKTPACFHVSPGRRAEFTHPVPPAYGGKRLLLKLTPPACAACYYVALSATAPHARCLAPFSSAFSTANTFLALLLPVQHLIPTLYLGIVAGVFSPTPALLYACYMSLCGFCLYFLLVSLCIPCCILRMIMSQFCIWYHTRLPFLFPPGGGPSDVYNRTPSLVTTHFPVQPAIYCRPLLLVSCPPIRCLTLPACCHYRARLAPHRALRPPTFTHIYHTPRRALAPFTHHAPPHTTAGVHLRHMLLALRARTHFAPSLPHHLSPLHALHTRTTARTLVYARDA